MAQQEFKSAVGEGIAYVVVGTSGTGKSSILNLFVDENDKAKVSHTSAAGTRHIKCHKYSDGSGNIFIDTIGIDDPEGKKDKEIEIEVLKYLQSNNISNVGIIWCVNPNQDRELKSLQTQAKYIDSFCPKKIWDSTVIVVKQGTQCAQKNGAIEAASKYFDKKIPCIGYTCFDWLVGDKRAPYETLFDICKGDLKSLKRMGYLSSKDVKILIENTLKNLKSESCQVLFENSKCIKCGIIGDSRVMPNRCHSKLRRKHDGELNDSKEHSGYEITTEIIKDVARYHDGSIEWVHPGCVISSHQYFLVWEWNHQSKYDCCGRWQGSEGCKKRYTCCGDDSGPGCKLKELKESKTTMSCCGGAPEAGCSKSKVKWTCCDAGANEKGCKKTCNACDQKWNDTSCPGCSDKFEHDIKSI